MMNTELRKKILAFLTPLPMLQSEDGRKAMLLRAGLEEILPHVDLSGPTGQSLTLLVNALEHYGTVENEPALIRLLREIGGQVGTDKQAMIEGLCEQLLKAQAQSPRKTAHQEPSSSTSDGPGGGIQIGTVAGNVQISQINGDVHGDVTGRDKHVYTAFPPDAAPQRTHAASPQVFLCYAREDRDMAERLYENLKAAGVVPWMDTKNLLPGQKWRILINQAIKDSSYVLTLLSSRSLSKQGFVQKEIERALDTVDTLSPADIFVIPVRLDDCVLKDARLKELHWVDLSPDYNEGLQQILRVLKPEAVTEPPIRADASADKPVEDPEPKSTRKQEPLPTQKADVHQQKAPDIVLRSKPVTVSETDAPEAFGMTGVPGRPKQYIQSLYEDRGEVVEDHATGLMWQKAGSDERMRFRETQAYLDRLNAQKFAGFNDWRLPTIPELLSLLEPEGQSNGLYINPVFDETQSWCWSADKRTKDESSPESAWLVTFNNGNVYWLILFPSSYVRAVRS